jgi:hypothetical protein
MTRLPSILFWIAFAAVLILLGPIGLAVAMLDSRPGGGGADWEAKLLIALLVLGAAFLTAFLVRALARLVLRLAGRGG